MRVSPRPAALYIDGKRVGRRARALEVPAGVRRIRAVGTRPRFEVRGRVKVRPGEHSTLALRPRKGRIRVMVRPWATVTLDGRRVGNTPMPPLEVLQGTHDLVLENSDLGARRRITVRVPPGRASVVKIQLR